MTVKPASLGYSESAEYLGVGLTTMKKLVREGHVRAVHIGRRAVVPLAELDAYLERRLAAAK